MSDIKCPHYPGLPAKCCPKCVRVAKEDEEFRARYRRAYGVADPGFAAFTDMLQDAMNKRKPS